MVVRLRCPLCCDQRRGVLLQYASFGATNLFLRLCHDDAACYFNMRLLAQRTCFYGCATTKKLSAAATARATAERLTQMRRWLRLRGDDSVPPTFEDETQLAAGAPVRAGGGGGSTSAEAAAPGGGAKVVSAEDVPASGGAAMEEPPRNTTPIVRCKTWRPWGRPRGSTRPPSWCGSFSWTAAT